MVEGSSSVVRWNYGVLNFVKGEFNDVICWFLLVLFNFCIDNREWSVCLYWRKVNENKIIFILLLVSFVFILFFEVYESYFGI